MVRYRPMLNAMALNAIALPVLAMMVAAVPAWPAIAEDTADPFQELQRLVGPPPARPQTPRPRPEPHAPVQPEIDTSYVPDPLVRRQVETLFVQQVARLDPGRAQVMAAQLASFDVFALFDQRVARYGLRPHHVADAVTAYWLVYWTTATNYAPDIPRGQAEAVRAQVSKALALTFGALDTNAKRQAMAEMVILRALNAASLAENARKSGFIPAQRNVANMAEAEFLAVGIDLRALDLRANGFSRRQ